MSKFVELGEMFSMGDERSERRKRIKWKQAGPQIIPHEIAMVKSIKLLSLHN